MSNLEGDDMGVLATFASSDRALTLSRLMTITTPFLFLALMTVGGFVINAKFAELADNAKAIADLAALQQVDHNDLAVLKASTAMDRQERLSTEAALTQGLASIGGKVDSLVGNVGTLSAQVAVANATLDIVKNRLLRPDGAVGDAGRPASGLVLGGLGTALNMSPGRSSP